VALSGAAPVPQTLLHWYRRLGLDVLEVYGMTESCGYSHIGRSGEHVPGWIGRPCPEVEVRIDEAGEVQVRSGATMQGYFKDPQKTAETLTEDGFLRTGDKGERRADGLLKLTGRVKELFKTSKGKYVAPAPIENRLNACPRIETSMVSGVGQPSAYAIVVLAETVRPQVKADPAFKAQVHAELEQLLDAVNAELPDYEKLQMLVVAPEPWSIENGMLTPTMKIKRARIESAVEPQLATGTPAKTKCAGPEGQLGANHSQRAAGLRRVIRKHVAQLGRRHCQVPLQHLCQHLAEVGADRQITPLIQSGRRQARPVTMHLATSYRAA